MDNEVNSSITLKVNVSDLRAMKQEILDICTKLDESHKEDMTNIK